MLKKILVAALAVTGIACAPAAAQSDYPEKPIKLVIPYRAGGGSDSLARMIESAIKKYDLMPEPLVVVNVDGAGGAVGARRVKDAEPDGYTFLQMHNEIFALGAIGRLGFQPLDAFEPVAQTTEACLYLAVPANSDFKTFDDIVAYAKDHPGKLKLADIVGGISHFTAVSIMNKYGIDFGVVQTGGTSARFASLKGGHTDMAFMSPGWIQRGGDELRGVLWMGDTQPEGAKDMPTAKSLGIDAVGCLKRRFWAPAGTPQDRVDYFADVLRKVMETPELKAYHEKQMSQIRFEAGDELLKDIEAEKAQFDQAAENVRKALGN